MRLRSSVPENTPLYGIWKVEEFTADGEVRTPPLTDSLRWRRVIFDSDPRLSPKSIARIQEMDGSFSLPYIATPDTNTSTVSLRSPSNAELDQFREILLRIPIGEQGGQGSAQFTYNRPSPKAMILEGLMNGHRLRMTLTKEEREFPLKTRRLHWIIEDKDVSW
jgi:hypothetical protein